MWGKRYSEKMVGQMHCQAKGLLSQSARDGELKRDEMVVPEWNA